MNLCREALRGFFEPFAVSSRYSEGFPWFCPWTDWKVRGNWECSQWNTAFPEIIIFTRSVLKITLTIDTNGSILPNISYRLFHIEVLFSFVLFCLLLFSFSYVWWRIEEMFVPFVGFCCWSALLQLVSRTPALLLTNIAKRSSWHRRTTESGWTEKKIELTREKAGTNGSEQQEKLGELRNWKD